MSLSASAATCLFAFPAQWDVLAVSCYGPLDGGLSALQEQMVADQAEASEKAAVGGGGGHVRCTDTEK